MVRCETCGREAPFDSGTFANVGKGRWGCREVTACMGRAADQKRIAAEDRANGAALRKLLTSEKQWELIVYADGSVVMSEETRGGGSYCLGVAGFAPMVNAEVG